MKRDTQPIRAVLARVLKHFARCLPDSRGACPHFGDFSHPLPHGMLRFCAPLTPTLGRVRASATVSALAPFSALNENLRWCREWTAGNLVP